MYSRLYGFARRRIGPGHRVIQRSLLELERSQWLPPAELAERQLGKIRDLVGYACENVPFYRELYRRAGVHPRDIRTFDDFRSLPLLTRDDVKDHRKDLISTAYRGEVVEGSTSGSTGQPMRYLAEKATSYWSYAAETRCRAWYGVRPGDRMARFLLALSQGSGRSWKSRFSDRVRGYRWLDPRNLDESSMGAFADVLLKWRPRMFRVYPSALTIFAKYLQERGIAGIRPVFIESTGEKVTLSQRRLFEEVFGAPTVDHYSSLEIYSIAYECPRGSLHIFEDRYLEVLTDGRAAGPGVTGDLVLTALNQYAMPFIRYQNGDVGALESAECPCGRGMPVLREMGGRKSDVFVTADGQPVHWTGVYLVMMPKHEIYQYQIYQPDRGRVEVSLVCKQDIEISYLERIRRELQPLFGEAMHITVKRVDDLPASASGKRLFLRSDVNPGSSL